MVRKRDIVVRVGADTTELQRGLRRTSDSLDKLAALGKRAGGLVAGGLLAAGAAISALAHKGLEAADQLQNVANKIGETTEGLATLRVMAREASVSVGTMEASLERATRRVGEFHASGGGPAAAWIERLNLDIGELIQLRPSELFEKYGEAIRGLNSRGEQLAALSALMGDESRALIAVIDQGGEAFSRAAEEARSLGLVLDETQKKNISEANAAMDRMKDAVQGASMQLAAAFGPAMTKTIELVTSLVGVVTNAVIRVYDFTRAVVGLRRAAEDISDKELADRIAEVSERIQRINERLRPEGHGIRKTQEEDLARLRAELAALEQEKAKRDALAQAAEAAHLSELEKIREDANKRRLEEQTEIEELLFQVFRDAEEKKKELRQQEFEQMWTNLEAELEILELQKQARKEATEAMIENLLIEVEEIEKAEEMKRAARKKTVDDLIGGLSSAFGAVSSHSKKMFEMSKLFAKGEAALNAYRAIQQVWADSTLPFYAKVAATAVTAAKTAANIAAINATQFGGGTTPSAAGTPTVNNVPVQQQVITIRGIDPSQLFTGRQIVDLVNQAQRDGARLVLAN